MKHVSQVELIDHFFLQFTKRFWIIFRYIYVCLIIFLQKFYRRKWTCILFNWNKKITCMTKYKEINETIFALWCFVVNRYHLVAYLQPENPACVFRKYSFPNYHLMCHAYLQNSLIQITDTRLIYGNLLFCMYHIYFKTLLIYLCIFKFKKKFSDWN